MQTTLEQSATDAGQAPRGLPPDQLPFAEQVRLNADHSVVFEGVAWVMYKLTRQAFTRSTRITYDRGRMEIMPPVSLAHEFDGNFLQRLLLIFLEARHPTFVPVGHTTLIPPAGGRAVEADFSYYIAADPPPSEARGIDLSVHNPPDLVIEIDLTSASIDKEPIYAALGVAELWRWDDDTLTLRRLRADRSGYDDASTSGLLPDLPVSKLADHVRLGRDLPQHEVVRRWRAAIEA